MQFKSAVALTVIWKLFSIPETFQARYRVKIMLSIKPRQKGKGTRAYSHVREVLLFHPLRFKNPFEAGRLDLSVTVASSGCTPGWYNHDPFVERKCTPCIGAHVASYKEYSKRRGRIVPATPGALIRFRPRGKDVVLTCNGWASARVFGCIAAGYWWFLSYPSAPGKPNQPCRRRTRRTLRAYVNPH